MQDRAIVITNRKLYVMYQQASFPMALTWTSRSRYFVKVIISKKFFLPARRYASAGYSDRNVSVRLFVRHAPVLCQNEES